MSRWFLLVTVLAACGDDTTSTPITIDAPASGDDAAVMIDAPPPPPAAVTVTATYRRSPKPDLHVVFYDATGAQIADAKTDATGTASAMIGATGTVVAMDDEGKVGYLWRGVVAGDHLQYALQPTALGPTTTIVLPAISNSDSYVLISSCSPATSSQTTTFTDVQMYFGCDHGDVIAYRYLLGAMVGSLYVSGQTLTAGGTLDLSGSATWGGTINSTITATHVPARFTSAIVESTLALVPDDYYGSIRDYVPTTAGTASITGKLPALPGLPQYTGASVRENTGAFRMVGKRGPQGDPSIDVEPNLLPLVEKPTFDAQLRTTSWTTEAALPAPSGAFVELVFAGNIHWLIATPDGEDVSIPALPASLAAIDPAGHAYITGSVRTFALAGGYAAVRPVMFALASQYALLPADGMLTISDSGGISSFQ